MNTRPPSSPAAPAFPDRWVRCPACGGQALYAARNPVRPFCSARCRQRDLGDWASDRFVLPASNEPEGVPPGADAF